MKNRKLMGVCLVVAGLSMMLSACGQKPVVKEVDIETSTIDNDDSEKEGTGGSKVVEKEIDLSDDAEKTDEIVPLTTSIRTIYANRYEEGTYKLLAKSTADTIEIYDEGYDNLKKSLKEYSQEAEKIANSFADEAESIYAEQGDEGIGIGNWYSEYVIKVRRADSKLLSFDVEGSSFMGGAHPYSFVTCMTYDSQTGNMLGIEDVVNNKDEFKKALYEQTKNHEYSDEFFEDWETTFENYFDDTQKDYLLNWSVTPYEICVHFNPYELGPYALGRIDIHLPFEEFGDLIKEEYTNYKPLRVYSADADYGSYYKEFAVDTNNDGNKEIICITGEDIYSDDYNPDTDYENAENYSIGMKITIGYGKDDTSARENQVEYEADISMDKAYVMQTENGKFFLYIQTASYNDYRILSIYDLNDSNYKIKEVAYNDGATFYDFAPVDGKHFALSDRINVMGTYGGYREYHVGEDGKPVPYDDVFILEGTSYEDMSRDMTLKTEIKGFEVEDINTCKLGAEVTLSEGTVLSPLYTNNEDIVIFSKPDGSLVAIKYDEGSKDSYPRYINKMDEEDVFDNIMYAG